MTNNKPKQVDKAFGENRTANPRRSFMETTIGAAALALIGSPSLEASGLFR
jgi:hypothetical protein